MTRGQPFDPNGGGRPTCYSCHRPLTHCVCKLIRPFEAHCNILVLQHPHERKKYYSTTKLLSAAVSNTKLLRGIEFETLALERALSGQKSYLLYPGVFSEDCESVPLDSKSTVIVVDGTWSEAGKIVFRNRFLSELPRLSFKIPLRSNYKIRKQPKDHCLSTIEAVGHLLKLNANASGRGSKVAEYDSLFDGFRQMVEKQLSYFPRMRALS